MNLDNNQKAFLELVKAGLWEHEVRFSQFEKVNFNEVLKLAKEQSVVGLVAAGLENVVDVKVPREWTLQIIGQTLLIEQRNKAMNAFVAELIHGLRTSGVNALLVKGQGVAQCYERPLWRSSGDVDLLLSDENYQKAKSYLLPIAIITEAENLKKKHLALKVNGFDVELHGRMPFLMSDRVDRVIDDVIGNSLGEAGTRVWKNGESDVLLPNVDDDVIIVFTHFLHHFFLEGVGLRQICDWCRLLWTYKASLNHRLLELRIQKMGLMSEWMAFGVLAVDRLGMPVEAMPFMKLRDERIEFGDRFQDKDYRKYKLKADGILQFVLEAGNFGHNRDVSYRAKKPSVVVNVITLWRRFIDFAKFTRVFPMDSPSFFGRYFLNRIKKAE